MLRPGHNSPVAGVGLSSLFLLVAAPFSVVLTLLLTRNVWLVFAIYHLGVCLLLPLVLSLGFGGLSLGGHCRLLGVADKGRKTWLEGGALFLLSGGLLLAADALAGDRIFSAARIQSLLLDWSVRPGQEYYLAWALAVFNPLAEELFWRGYLQGRLPAGGDGWLPLIWISLGFSGYHGFTVYLLLGSFPLALAILAGIGGAGLFWGWLRRRTGSVWPAVLSHMGAAWAYVLIWLTLQGGP